MVNFSFSFDRDFRITMISDLCLPPLGGQAEAAMFMFLQTVFQKSEPDLVVFTGGLGEPTQQKERLKRFCAWMDECSIPWAFAFGDEDRSFFTPVRTLESTLLSSATCLYERGDPHVRGEGNYAVALQDPQGNTRWILWMLDTGDAVVRTPFFHNVIDWCAKARAAIQENCQMLCFCHRALPEFAAFAPEKQHETTENYGLFASLMGDARVSGIFAGQINQGDGCGELDGICCAYGVRTGAPVFGLRTIQLPKDPAAQVTTATHYAAGQERILP